METNYKGLYVPRQRYAEHKGDKISSVQTFIDDINREQLELGQSITSFLCRYWPVHTYRLLVLFSLDVDWRFLAQLPGGMKAYEPVHVMKNTILNRNNWTQSANRSRDVKRPPKPLCHNTPTIFVG